MHMPVLVSAHGTGAARRDDQRPWPTGFSRPTQGDGSGIYRLVLKSRKAAGRQHRDFGTGRSSLICWSAIWLRAPRRESAAAARPDQNGFASNLGPNAAPVARPDP